MSGRAMTRYEQAVSIAIDHKIERDVGRRFVLADHKFVEMARAAGVHPSATAGEVLRRAGFRLKQAGKTVFVIGRA